MKKTLNAARLIIIDTLALVIAKPVAIIDKIIPQKKQKFSIIDLF